ncbi:MAG: hypothetical protein QOH27_3140 [Mycobacterium sp.]|jgi:hypothetical protein|nr:hypothetical protein [Mycobacterium sp.]MDT7757242.1 hypothetical protein [Mycobacterium sp.]
MRYEDASRALLPLPHCGIGLDPALTDTRTKETRS